ncbi:DNA-processing protein DprA [Prescottella equi]|uniref:DNA-processing protein DprA n=1 Tax=Rhodococcus hoagii TaxID=43767 RepID=UPI000D111150|nr:DNA-processing protein DprA [Prescottella equi]AVP68253.1 DNA-protecting protein DprA [Prescottella equi]MBM4633628.1 DNA-protecting protein DprA [Prescottella equi]
MTGHDPRLLAWAYLSKVVQGACPPLAQLAAAVGPVDAARAVRERDLSSFLDRRTSARAHLDTAARDLDLLRSMGGRLVTPDDDEWPRWRLLAFDALGSGRDDGAPLALWVLGDRSVDELAARSVAVVGTRAASSYGEHVTAEIAGDLAADGWTIVSGAAFGVDAAAHRAALGVGGLTVAVLACGVDRAYPAGHGRLLQQIARDGAVISEYPPATSPARYRFLARNRLVAGLSEAVVVVEAGWRSGARNTATWGRRLGRPVLAVPGPVTSAASTGCHRMIREGEARLVSSAADVVEEAGPIGVDGEGLGPARALDVLQGDAATVYEALPAVGTCSTRELSEESGVTIERVRAVLPVLELDGFVGSDESGWFRRG